MVTIDNEALRGDSLPVDGQQRPQIRETRWQDAGEGWVGTEGSLRLLGWSLARRVVILRRRLSQSRSPRAPPDGQAGGQSLDARGAGDRRLRSHRL
jgi:hypothetical protein